MISKEQIAHELTMIYMNNRYGVDISGTFDVSTWDDLKVSGSGSVKTDRFPSVKKSKYIKVGTGEKGFLGFEKKKSVESGYEVDGIFTEMIEDYYQAYSRFLQLLKEKENTIEE